MPATLSDYLALGTAVLRDVDPVAVRFRRGTQQAILTVAPGKDLRWPYNGAAIPPVGKRFWLPKPFRLGGVPCVPREGDLLEVELRTYELVPFGQEPAAMPASADSAWRVHALDTTDQPRRDTVVDLEVPDPAATRAASGNKDRTAYTVSVADLYVTVILQAASTEQIGGKNVQVRTFRVLLAGRDVPASARFAVKTGFLAGLHLYVGAVSRDSAAGLETTCVCRCVGG